MSAIFCFLFSIFTLQGATLTLSILYIHKVYFYKHCDCRKSVTYQLPKPMLNCVVSSRIEYTVLNECVCALTRKISMFFLLLFFLNPIRRHNRLLYSCLFELLAYSKLCKLLFFRFIFFCLNSLSLFLSPCRHFSSFFLPPLCSLLLLLNCLCHCHDFTTSIEKKRSRPIDQQIMSQRDRELEKKTYTHFIVNLYIHTT